MPSSSACSSRSPPPVAGPIASIKGDPHIRGAHGDRADFKGEHLGIYVVLSTKLLSLAVQFEHDKFFTRHSKMWVKGSWIRHAYWTIRTSGGRLLKIELDAHHPKFNGSATAQVSVFEDVHFSFDHKTLTVRTPTWRTKAEVTKGWPHWGKLRMNIEVQPLYDTATDMVAPHGLLGQTYDEDGIPTHGKRDSYEMLDNGFPTRSRQGIGGIVTTRAKAEGAIEGTAEMYRVKHAFDTKFLFSRFGLRYAPPRNVSMLRGRG